MNLHEFQGKQLFASYGIPVSDNRVVQSVEEVADACKALPGSRWVVKAQVHAGGRGKSGGVKLVDTIAEAEDFAKKWLGQTLVTYQNAPEGQPVENILIETCTDIDRELYFSIVLDRDSRKLCCLSSTEGGVEIETVANETPEKILRESIDPLTGAQPWQGRRMASGLGLNKEQTRDFTKMFQAMVNMVVEKDLSLLEVNPLVITEAGKVHCLDAKVGVEDDALYRQPALADMRDSGQEDEREARAASQGLSYVSLDGNIGCMVNGAGLAMATMDILALSGGAPANFLDVGGRTNADRVAEALKIILEDSKVKVILINIFGGIVRCDLIAEGVLQAVNEIGLSLPVVVRLEGNQSEAGRRVLAEANHEHIHEADGLSDAAKKAVELAQ